MMIDTVLGGGDTLSPICVTSAEGMAAGTTVVTRSTFRNGEGPRGVPGTFDAAERKELKQETRLVSPPAGISNPGSTTNLVMRGNATLSVTAGSDKRTLVRLRRSRVSRDIYARTTR